MRGPRPGRTSRKRKETGDGHGPTRQQVRDLPCHGPHQSTCQRDAKLIKHTKDHRFGHTLDAPTVRYLGTCFVCLGSLLCSTVRCGGARGVARCVSSERPQENETASLKVASSMACSQHDPELRYLIFD